MAFQASELPQASDLRLFPEDWQAAALSVLRSMAAVTAFIIVLDLVFRPALPADYVAFFGSPLGSRTLGSCIGSLLEEVRYRLILLTCVILAVRLLLGRVPAHWWIIGIALTQFINVAPWVMAYPLYGALRFWCVGSVWGWLYWRHGWLAAAVGHSATHLLLDPLLLLALSSVGS